MRQLKFIGWFFLAVFFICVFIAWIFAISWLMIQGYYLTGGALFIVPFGIMFASMMMSGDK